MPQFPTPQNPLERSLSNTSTSSTHTIRGSSSSTGANSSSPTQAGNAGSNPHSNNPYLQENMNRSHSTGQVQGQGVNGSGGNNGGGRDNSGGDIGLSSPSSSAPDRTQHPPYPPTSSNSNSSTDRKPPPSSAGTVIPGSINGSTALSASGMNTHKPENIGSLPSSTSTSTSAGVSTTWRAANNNTAQQGSQAGQGVQSGGQGAGYVNRQGGAGGGQGRDYVQPYGNGGVGGAGGGGGQNGNGGNNDSPTTSSDPQWGAPFPSLHLWPLNETFVTKMVHLPVGERVKIGRQTNVKTQPHERNGYFDSKVLSRMHAELWAEESNNRAGQGKIFIKDVRSSNGTFVNGERLSNEGMESEPFELKSEDLVEFGIDIVSEDNKTVVHHKVSAKAYCVWNVEDAALSARELAQYFPFDPSRAMGPTRKGTGVPPQGALLPMGMMSAGGKGIGLNFDHVLARLQAELEKSKETGAELQNLTTAMTDIQETLAGGLPPDQNGVAAQHIPPQFRPPENKPVIIPGIPEYVIGDPSATIAALQAQLGATQSILMSHKDRIKSLESLLNEHEAIKDEVMALRQQMEASKQEFETILQEQANIKQSVESDDDQSSEWGDIKKPTRRGPKSPSNHPDDASAPRSPFLARSGSTRSMTSLASQHKANEDLVNQNMALTSRLDAISADLEQALEMSRSLQRQHAEATSAVKTLEKQVAALEKDMAAKVADAAGKVGKAAEDRWEVWRTKFEEGWRKEREGWEQERERLKGVVREWEEASRRAQEEEEERLMNGRLSSESEEDESGDEDEEPGSPRGDDWIASGLIGRGGSDLTSGPIMRPPDRSHSASPRSSSSSSSKQSRDKIRRESSTRLDPAIRALRAAAGDTAHDASPNGVSTPRTGSPSHAEGALEALRAKSGRSKRAPTITGRKRDPTKKMSGSHDLKALHKLRLAQSDSTATLTGLDGEAEAEDDRARAPSESTSTESDETAHEQSSKPATPVTDKKDAQAVVPAAKNAVAQPASMMTHPIPVAVSIAVVAVAAWTYINRVKE